MSDISLQVETELEVLYEPSVELESSEEPPWEEWSSLLCYLTEPNLTEKQRLFIEGKYQPPSEEICGKYIPLSDSSVLRHPYYPYPSVTDPGIEKALFQPPEEIVYAKDGQDCYLALCKEMGEAYSRIFHRQLLEPCMNMKYYGISSAGWRPMALALMRNETVQSIDFTSNFITLDGCYHFGQLLLVNYTISELNFTGCRMGPHGVKMLVANLTNNQTLRKINLSKNRLGDPGVQYLSDVIYKGANITDINLSCNELTTKSATYLADAIEFVNKLTHLDLSWNSLVIPRPLEILISRFVESEKFLEINLAWNALTNRFAKGLSNLLLCPNITIINLSNNNLTGNVINLIAENLPFAKRLNVLDLSFNPLTIPEAKLLLRFMRLKRTKLKQLLMDNVYVDDQFVAFKNRMLALKIKKDRIVTHGYVMPKTKARQKDMRNIILRRAEFVCRKPKKKRVDVGTMLLRLNKMKEGACIPSNQLKYAVKELGAFQLNKDLVEGMAAAFPGPRIGMDRTTNVAAMADYAKRLWPDTKLPPTPPPRPPLAAQLPAKEQKEDKNKGNKAKEVKDKSKIKETNRGRK